jgi:hypothetical protein
MNSNLRAADITAGVLGCAILASVAVAVTRLLTPTYPFSYSVDAAKLFGAIAAGSLVAFSLAAAARHVSPRVSLTVTRRLAVVVAALACYEALLFAVIAPRVIGDVVLPIVAGLAVEIIPIALISAVVWGGRAMNMRRRTSVFALAAMLCILGVAAVSPAVLRGAAEQVGWLATPPRHFSGVHELPLTRHLSYVILGAIAGLLFARNEENQMTS